MYQIALLILLAVIAVWGWYLYYQRGNTGSSQTESVPSNQQVEPLTSDPTSRLLLTSTLRKLNIEYELDRDNDFIITYHGEKILLVARDDDPMLHIKDYWWYSAPLDDIENLSIVHRAVNECNTRCYNTLFYDYTKDDHEINVHSTRDILWIPQIPDIDKYLRETLDDLLKMHNYFFRWIEEIRREKHAETNK